MSPEYKLNLTTPDGTLIDQWTIGDIDSEYATFTYPIEKLSVYELAQEVNQAIKRNGGLGQ